MDVIFINLVQNNYNNNINQVEYFKCVGCTHMHTLFEKCIAWLARDSEEIPHYHLVFMMQDFSQSMTEVLSCEKILLDV